ncbi:membrane transporter [Schizosaccharomyces japonicus yFS275]|uniref:Membrane transporter n=1 Tax=Schizosaccharomyces japonicus (strain yFS275 / FY16936) TaxID=402676 RepID=B6K2R7_SCHJY|nr:membrane transporter [Schizosaccharomyces japonicus yFS275]EEB07448.2 membrane transporter [Schizosaccharomyces japonicus yFS275]
MVPSSYKWGYYIFSVLAYFHLLWKLYLGCRLYASKLKQPTRRYFRWLCVYISFIKLLILVNWAFCEGGNMNPPVGEAAVYGILDVLGLPAFGILFMWMLEGLNAQNLSHQQYLSTILFNQPCCGTHSYSSNPRDSNSEKSNKFISSAASATTGKNTETYSSLSVGPVVPPFTNEANDTSEFLGQRTSEI